MKHITNIALGLALLASTGLSGMELTIKNKILTNIKQDTELNDTLNDTIDQLKNDLVVDGQINPSKMKNYIAFVKQAAHHHAEKEIENSPAKALEQPIINFTKEVLSVVSGLPSNAINIKCRVIGIDAPYIDEKAVRISDTLDKRDNRFQEQEADVLDETELAKRTQDNYDSRDLAPQSQKDVLTQNNVRKQKRKVVLNSTLRKQRRQSMLNNKRTKTQKAHIAGKRKRVSLDNTMRKKRRIALAKKSNPVAKNAENNNKNIEQELEKKKLEVIKQLELIQHNETMKQKSNQGWLSWGWNKVKQYTTNFASNFVYLAQTSLDNWQKFSTKQKVAILAIAATATTAYFLAQSEGEISCMEQAKADLERILSYCSDNPTDQMCIDNIDRVQFYHYFISR